MLQYEIIPGSVAANATAWGCQGGSGCPTTKGSFDFTRFNVSYWRNYERLLRSMRASGVIADIIVFHPYDGGQWGFDCMGGTDPSHYNTSNDERCKSTTLLRLLSRPQKPRLHRPEVPRRALRLLRQRLVEHGQRVERLRMQVPRQ